MNFSLLALLIVFTSASLLVVAQFPQGGPNNWGRLPSGSNNRFGAFGGGNEKSGSINLGGQQRLNNKFDVRGKVGIDYGRGGYLNKKADIGLGYNVNKDTQIRGSVGIDKNKFGSDRRVGVGIEHRFG